MVEKIHVRIRLFSVFKDVVGTGKLELEFPPNTKIKNLIEYLRKEYPNISRYIDETEPEPVIVLINGRPAKPDSRINEGDEIAIFPPAAGGVEGKIVQDRVKIEKVLETIKKDPDFLKAGALVIFIGHVKGVVENGKEVYELIYEAYEPYASKKLHEIACEAAKHENVVDVRIYHRISKLKPKDETLYIFVTATDRKTAFKTAENVLEQVKKEAPIWKLEIRDDGEYWIVGNGKRIPRPKRDKIT